MKKTLPVLLAVSGIFPYAVLVGMTWDNAILEAVFALGLACAIAICVLSRRGTWAAGELALGSMIVKLAQIPAYAAWFIVGAAFFLYAGFALAFVVDALTILLSGLAGLAAVLRCRAEGKLGRRAAVLHGILQFVFCADVFSAVWICYQSRKK